MSLLQGALKMGMDAGSTSFWIDIVYACNKKIVAFGPIDDFRKYLCSLYADQWHGIRDE